MTGPLRAVAAVIAALASTLLGACSGSDGPRTEVYVPGCASATVKVPPGGAQPAWSADFRTWLEAHGYAHLAANQGWGGGTACAFPRSHDPVVFLHGNSGAADPTGAVFDLLKASLVADPDTDYGDCDFYAIAWVEQPPAGSDTSVNHHAARYLKLVRDLVQAVKGYTGSAKVDVVGYSMGVTLGRKAIAGGVAFDDPARAWASACDLGPSLAGSVDTFLGVAGVNRGLHMCTGASTNACSENGFRIDGGFLRDLNGGSGGTYAPAPLAARVYSVVLPDDEYVCGDDPRGRGAYLCEVLDVHTSHIPGETGAVSLDLVNSGSNDHCDPAVPEPFSCDHATVLGDADALPIMVRLLRNDETVLDPEPLPTASAALRARGWADRR